MTSDAPDERASELRRLAASFGQAADSYDRYRPGYPVEAVAEAVGGATRVLDLGAGTGKVSRLLRAVGARQVWAVEPDPQMLAVLTSGTDGVTALQGSAEQIPLPDAGVEVVVVGQALHWFDLDRALPEIARVLEPGGRLVCLWNTSDTRDEFTRGWVRAQGALARPHGDPAVTAADLPPPFADDRHFGEPRVRLFHWSHRMTGAELHGLVDTYSYVLTAEPAARVELHRRLEELIGERQSVAIAERCEVWTAERR